MTYLLIKHAHTLAATLTIMGFLLRGYWMLTESDKLTLKVTRIVPHIIDATLLLAAVVLVVMLSINPLTQPWLFAKFIGILVYILLGTIAIKRGPTKEIRIIAFIGAVSAFAYIVGVALSKSPASWLALSP